MSKKAFTLAESGQRPHLNPGFGRCAFTLAEVLIALAVIGIVAALTMPGVIQEYKAKTTVVKVKKTYSVLANAINLAIAEYGTFDSWGLIPGNEQSLQLFGSRMKAYLNVIEDCGTASSCQNYKAGNEKFLNGSSGHSSLNFSQPTHYKLLLADGTLVSFRTHENYLCTDENTCIGVYIDTNGNKKPNMMGIDIFSLFSVLPSKITQPVGYGYDPSTTSSPWFSCNPKKEGWYCTAWVFYKENMDYLKCADELTWNGKTSCK